MIPHRVALALQADGWYIRQELVWSKPAPMPESVTDRCTRSHEFIFMLAKQPAYYYDAAAIAEPATAPPGRLSWEERKGRGEALRRGLLPTPMRHSGGFSQAATRTKRSVWTIGPQPLADEHYAAFPEKLVAPMILAGTSEAGCCPRCATPYRRVVERERTFESGSGRRGVLPTGKNGADMQGGGATLDIRRGPVVHTTTTGWEAGCTCDAGPPLGCTVLDIFCGSGTTGVVAKRYGRNFIGIELNESYCKLSEKRIAGVCAPLFTAATVGNSSAGAAR